jgi:hypothetical protein
LSFLVLKPIIADDVIEIISGYFRYPRELQ